MSVFQRIIPFALFFFCSFGLFSGQTTKQLTNESCSPLEEPNVIFTCFYMGENVNCGTFMKPGTIASYTCAKHYELVDASAFSPNITCAEDGTWSDAMPTCVHECGKENPSHKSGLIDAYGQYVDFAVLDVYPWRAGIYNYIEHNDSFVNECEGTLISDHTVITDANCLFDGVETLNLDQLRVVCGKYYKDWSIAEDHRQILRVREIKLQGVKYNNNGTIRKDSLSLALLNPEKSFILSDYVLPVCLNAPPVNRSRYGAILGWPAKNKEPTGMLGEHMKLMWTRKLCLRLFNINITEDKFCVGDVLGRGAVPVGTGITSLVEGVHYLHGVVNYNIFKIGGLNKSEYFTSIFTNVSVYTEWIKGAFNEQYRQQKIL